MKTSQHKSVLLDEAVEGLVTDRHGTYVDATFGRGGHTSAILDRCDADARVVAFDRDQAAIDYGRRIDDVRLTLVHAPFSQMRQRLAEIGIEQVDGVLMDLGVSSPQLDEDARGFSFMRDGPLDMRMDQTSGPTAAQWLAEVDEGELIRVLREFGEERFAKRIARAIVATRDEEPFTSTGQLAAFVAANLPTRERKKNPATRTFQAIRIAVNGELDELEKALVEAHRVLRPGGRLVVISFHSLEDRLVKRFIAVHAGAGVQIDRRLPPPPDLPEPTLRKISRLKPGATEVSKNPRARSAVLRIAERTAA